MQDKRPFNDKNQPHGKWEVYWSNGNVWDKGNFINGVPYGCMQTYYPNGEIDNKRYYAR